MNPVTDQQPNLDEVRCVNLHDGQSVRLSIRRISNNQRKLEVVATREDGEALYSEVGDHPHLALSRAESGTDTNRWLPDHVHMFGAKPENGLSAALLDFAVDVAGLNLVRSESPSPERDAARRHYDHWQNYRQRSQPTRFRKCSTDE